MLQGPGPGALSYCTPLWLVPAQPRHSAYEYINPSTFSSLLPVGAPRTVSTFASYVGPSFTLSRVMHYFLAVYISFPFRVLVQARIRSNSKIEWGLIGFENRGGSSARQHFIKNSFNAGELLIKASFSIVVGLVCRMWCGQWVTSSCGCWVLLSLRVRTSTEVSAGFLNKKASCVSCAWLSGQAYGTSESKKYWRRSFFAQTAARILRCSPPQQNVWRRFFRCTKPPRLTACDGAWAASMSVIVGIKLVSWVVIDFDAAIRAERVTHASRICLLLKHGQTKVKKKSSLAAVSSMRKTSSLTHCSWSWYGDRLQPVKKMKKFSKQ